MTTTVPVVRPAQPTTRVALYARVSTSHQVEHQTIEQQLDRLHAHVAAQPDWALDDAHMFRDAGHSGAVLARPGLDGLRDAAKRRELDRVLVTAPDRLARNYVHQMVLLEELARAGCAVDFLDRPMSADPHDQLVLQIRGAVAEYERTLIGERMRRGRLTKLRAGLLLPWTYAPYGYHVAPDRPRDPRGVAVAPAEAAVVAELFARYREPGTSLAKLAEGLTAAGVPTPFGRPRWSAPSVRGILRNPAYTGHVYAQRTRVRPAQVRRSATHPIGHPQHTATPQPVDTWLYVGPIPALVSQAHFDEVQQKLAQNRGFARRHNTAHWYLLRALVSCGRCSLACTGRCLNGRHRYYQCNGKQQRVQAHRATRCPARYIPAAQLDDLVWADLCALLTEPAPLSAALERAHGGAWLPQDLAARRDHLRRGQAHLAQQLERLTDAYLHAVIPLDEYERRRRPLEQKHAALGAQAAQLAGDAERRRELAGVAASLEAFRARVQQGLAGVTFEQRRELLLLLVDRVIVTDGEVEIRYVLPTSPESEHVRFCHLRKDYFHDPAVPAEAGAGVHATPRDAGPDAARGQRARDEGGGVRLVRVELGGAPARSPHPPAHRRDRVDAPRDHGDLVLVRGRQELRERNARRVGDDVPLRAWTTAVRRGEPGHFLGDGAPPFARTVHAATTARSQSRASAPRSSARTACCKASQTPAACQSRSRRQQVMPEPQPTSCGSRSH